VRKLLVLIAVMAVVATLLPAAHAGPTAGGFTSDNVEYVDYVPFEVGTATGARVIGKYMYVTSWRGFSIYDVSSPESPQLLSTTPYAKDAGREGFRFENEDVATNGKILVMSEELPHSVLYIYNVEDKTNPVLLSATDGLGQHTMSCLFDCKWLWGSDGFVIDLRDPTKPVLQDGKWTDNQPTSNGHDVTEVKPGLVVTSSQPIMFLDARKDVVHPKLLAQGASADGRFIHSTLWPGAKDKFLLAGGETNFKPQCSANNGKFSTWDATKWKKTHSFQMIDEYVLENGTFADGKPAANGNGCSTHWFSTHPAYHNGGLVALGAYDHGTRIVNVDGAGKIAEVGWFLPYGGETSVAFWASKDIVYAIDYTRGFDILKFNGIQK
jgi:hypothetical protein